MAEQSKIPISDNDIYSLPKQAPVWAGEFDEEDSNKCIEWYDIDDSCFHTPVVCLRGIIRADDGIRKLREGIWIIQCFECGMLLSKKLDHNEPVFISVLHKLQKITREYASLEEDENLTFDEDIWTKKKLKRRETLLNKAQLSFGHSLVMNTFPQDKDATWFYKYLKTNEWLSLRASVLDKYAYRCATCNSDKDIRIHHRTYERLGNERLSDLTALCDSCHAKFHGQEIDLG